MSKKVCCPHCYLVTSIEEDQEVYTCPKCSKEVDVVQARRMLELILTRYINDAFKFIYEEHEYESAIKSCTRYLELDEDNEDIVLYLVIAYLKSNRVREDNFEKIFALLDEHETLLSNFSNEDTKITDVVEEIIEIVEDYLSKLKNVLSEKGVFYEKACLDLYLKEVDNVNKLFERFTKYFFAEKILEHEDEVELSKKDYLDRIEVFRKLKDEEYDYMDFPKKHLVSDNEDELIDDILFVSGDKYKKTKKIANIVLAISIVLLIVGLIFISNMRDNPVAGIIMLGIGAIGALGASMIKAVIAKKSE